MAGGLEKISAEDAGMSASRLARARDYAERVGKELSATGGAVLVTRHDRIVGEWYWGQRGPDNPQPFDADTLALLYSVTKGFTATALALLVEDGIVWLDDPVGAYVEEMRQGEMARLTLRHLATHSSGFPAGDSDFYGCWRDQREGETLPQTYFRHALMRGQRGLAYEPGTNHVYSDPAVTILGEAIYRACNLRVPDLIRRRLFDPLGLKHIGWDFDDEGVLENIADVVDMSWQDHPPDTTRWRKCGFVTGGLISTARDLAVCGLMLLHEGEYAGVRVMSPLTVRMMTSCQYPQPARARYPHRGLFWWIKAAPDSPEMGSLVPYGTYAHGGACHSVLVVMPALDVVAIMIRNRVGNPPGFVYDRDYPVFMDLVASAVTPNG